MPPKFSFSVRSFTPPELPPQPTDVPASEFRSPQITSIANATTPLLFTVSLPSARDKDPLYPATHLQLAYRYEGSGEIFPAKTITAKNLVESDDDGDEHLYIVEVPAEDVPRAKVNEGATSDADVTVYAWRDDKLLGKCSVGKIENLGFVGLKSTPLHIARQKAWEARQPAR